MKHNNSNAEHEFALYCASLPAQLPHQGTVTVHDEALAHRIQHVLRMAIGQQFQLFDGRLYAQCVLQEVGKRSFSVSIISSELIQPLTPNVTFLLPVLKKESFETALYSLVEAGATAIQPVITNKIHRQWITAKDYERLQRIIIAAAEQAKQFALPSLAKPQELSELCAAPYQGVSIFFDPHGRPLFEVLKEVAAAKPSHLRLLIGPEADLTTAEKDMVAHAGFQFCALTPTILRASSAAALAQGVVRAIF